LRRGEVVRLGDKPPPDDGWDFGVGSQIRGESGEKSPNEQKKKGGGGKRSYGCSGDCQSVGQGGGLGYPEGK